MKLRILLITLLFISVNSFSQEIENIPFKAGEWLKFKVSYGVLNAGFATLEVKEGERENAFHLDGNGWSIGMFKWFFKVEDRYQSFIDDKTLLPHKFVRDVSEGGYKINREIYFYRDNLSANITDRKADKRADSTYTITKTTLDMVSAFYYARSYDESEVSVGDKIFFDIFMDYEVFDFYLKYHGKEIIETKFGKIECMKFTPLVQSGRVFKENEGVTLWVSADENKIPIRIQSELRVGSIKVDLDAFKGLKFPFKVIHQ